MAGGARREVGPPVQHADVHEPRQRVQRAVPAVRSDGGGKELIDARFEPVEAGNPSRGREFRGPDDVELQDVGIARPGVQPLHVQLMPLVRRVRRGPQRDVNRGVRLAEPIELAPDHFAFAPDEAAGKRQDVRLRPDAALRRQHRRRRGRPEDPGSGVRHLLVQAISLHRVRSGRSRPSRPRCSRGSASCSQATAANRRNPSNSESPVMRLSLALPLYLAIAVRGRFSPAPSKGALLLCILCSWLPACSSRGALRVPQQIRATQTQDETKAVASSRASQADQRSGPRERVTDKPDATRGSADSSRTHPLAGADAATSNRTSTPGWSLVVTTTPGAQTAPSRNASELPSISSGHDSTRFTQMKRFVDAAGVLVGVMCAVLAVRRRLQVRRRP